MLEPGDLVQFSEHPNTNPDFYGVVGTIIEIDDDDGSALIECIDAYHPDKTIEPWVDAGRLERYQRLSDSDELRKMFDETGCG